MYDENSFKKNTDLFYNTYLSYVKKWGCHIDQLNLFRWVQLTNCSTWENVQKCIQYLMENNRNNSNLKLMKIIYLINSVMFLNHKLMIGKKFSR